jgi:hypothetical protein
MSQEVTLKVPAKHFAAFKSAVVSEIGTDASWVESGQDELERHRLTKDHVDAPVDLVDIQGAADALGEVMVVAQQLFAVRRGPVTLSGDRSTFAHMCETMADKIVAPRIADAANTTPYDTETAEEISLLSDALGWATGEAARLHAEWQVARAVAS